MDDSQDRHLPASDKKLERARRDGTVPRSRDLSHFVALGGGGALLVALAEPLAGWSRELLAAGLHFDAAMLARPQMMTAQLAELTLRMLWLVLPFGLLMLIAGLCSAVVSGGWNFTLKPLLPQLSRLNPLTGLGRLFSGAHLGDTLKAILLACVLASIGLFYLKANLSRFSDALTMSLPQALAHTAQAMLFGLLLVLLALAAFAAIDVPLQRHLWRARLKMSAQELKQEHRDAEGNVEVKAKVRARMRELVKRRMLAAVPQADLVVMNPQHYAVALKYDDAAMAAPRVVAKGADLLALRIRDIAREARVPVLNAPPLARALYAHAEIDREIPAALFAAVAQVLAHVYQLRAALTGRGQMPAELPEISVPPGLDPHHPDAGEAPA